MRNDRLSSGTGGHRLLPPGFEDDTTVPEPLGVTRRRLATGTLRPDDMSRSARVLAALPLRARSPDWTDDTERVRAIGERDRQIVVLAWALALSLVALVALAGWRLGSVVAGDGAPAAGCAEVQAPAR
jgi:hypothetical protein